MSRHDLGHMAASSVSFILAAYSLRPTVRKAPALIIGEDVYYSFRFETIPDLMPEMDLEQV